MPISSENWLGMSSPLSPPPPTGPVVVASFVRKLVKCAATPVSNVKEI